ncbi:DUF5786 family protein [Haladaptatus pallidirubidus]|uniref:DUF5786 domain-containing protein n=1 Tax=Haladaptatus pallidirubidus TaxID=1008152 RepID=A0AAV3URY3_9EURY|nr:DUF5786 family protein [Haladaptatus pallidirubidus]
MSMGTFDAEEHERREKKISSVVADSDDQRTNFEGQVEYTGDDSIEELLARLKEVKAK